MTTPPINPKKTVAGIAVDPQSLERVIPESRRQDGSVRKKIKIRPGYTPQEDVQRFRGTKQAQLDVNALPKGHIVGWAPPQSTAIHENGSGKSQSRSSKKNAKRKEKRGKIKDIVPQNWEDESETGQTTTQPTTTQPAATASAASTQKPITPSKSIEPTVIDITKALEIIHV